MASPLKGHISEGCCQDGQLTKVPELPALISDSKHLRAQSSGKARGVWQDLLGCPEREWAWLQERPELCAGEPEGQEGPFTHRHGGKQLLGSREGFMVEVTPQVSLEGCVGALQMEDRVEAFQTNSCRGECCLPDPSRQRTGDNSLWGSPAGREAGGRGGGGVGVGQTVKDFPLTEP